MCGTQTKLFKISFTQIFFTCGIFLLKSNYVHQYKHNFDDGNVSFFRFHDFEPRAFQSSYNDTSYQDLRSEIGKRIDTIGIKNFVDKELEGNIKREGRGFHIQASDKDLTVEIEFIIPFANVPIEYSKKFVKTSVRKLLNLHTGALLWSGAFFVVGAVVAGLVNTVSALKPGLYAAAAGLNGLKKTTRKTDDDKFLYYKDNLNSFQNLLERKLTKHNINIKSCVQLRICLYVQKITNDVISGRASRTQKILEGFFITEQIQHFLRGTAVSKAIKAGQNLSCDEFAGTCDLPMFGKTDIFKYFKKVFY